MNWEKDKPFVRHTTPLTMVDVGIITPIKDEVENLPYLIDSVLNQTLQPRCWVIVNDGSSDGSRELIKNASEKFDWIQFIDKDDKSDYEMRVNYADVLSTGYKELNRTLDNSIDYYMVLDGDMRLTKQYIGQVCEVLEMSEDLVIASGGIYVKSEDGLELEKRSPIHPAGGATLYDGAFYRAIGGPPLVPGVDSATEVKARIRGFDCRYLTEIEAKAVQSRPTGHKGDIWENAKMRGSNNYVLGQRLIVMLGKAIWMSRTSPYYYGIGALFGYLSDMLTREDKIDDKELLEYYRRRKPIEISKNSFIIAKNSLFNRS